MACFYFICCSTVSPIDVACFKQPLLFTFSIYICLPWVWVIPLGAENDLDDDLIQYAHLSTKVSVE